MTPTHNKRRRGALSDADWRAIEDAARRHAESLTDQELIAELRRRKPEIYGEAPIPNRASKGP